jgi:hypothetical protein
MLRTAAPGRCIRPSHRLADLRGPSRRGRARPHRAARLRATAADPGAGPLCRRSRGSMRISALYASSARRPARSMPARPPCGQHANPKATRATPKHRATSSVTAGVSAPNKQRNDSRRHDQQRKARPKLGRRRERNELSGYVSLSHARLRPPSPEGFCALPRSSAEGRGRTSACRSIL